jgi:hypothetical protein
MRRAAGTILSSLNLIVTVEAEASTFEENTFKRS